MKIYVDSHILHAKCEGFAKYLMLIISFEMQILTHMTINGTL